MNYDTEDENNTFVQWRMKKMSEGWDVCPYETECTHHHTGQYDEWSYGSYNQHWERHYRSMHLIPDDLSVDEWGVPV